MTELAHIQYYMLHIVQWITGYPKFQGTSKNILNPERKQWILLQGLESLIRIYQNSNKTEICRWAWETQRQNQLWKQCNHKEGDNYCSTAEQLPAQQQNLSTMSQCSQSPCATGGTWTNRRRKQLPRQWTASFCAPTHICLFTCLCNSQQTSLKITIICLVVRTSYVCGRLLYSKCHTIQTMFSV